MPAAASRLSSTVLLPRFNRRNEVKTDQSTGKPRPIEPLWLVEKRAIETAIAQCGGQIDQAAGLLGVAPSTIYRKLASWNKKRRTVSPGT